MLRPVPGKCPGKGRGGTVVRRFSIVAGFVVALTALSVVAALAGGGQTNGNGTTSAGAHLGINAKADLTGNFQYQAAGGSLNIHCHGYDFYVQTTSANGQYPKSLVNSHNCFDQDGNQYFLHAEFVDEGEPGTRDKACITFKAADGSVAVLDCGTITGGNIQIH